MSARRRTATYVAFGAAMFALLALSPLAFAGKPGKTSTSGTSGPMKLVSETVTYYNANSPTSCMSEDDYDSRVFQGSLSGSLSTTFQLCGTVDGVDWSAGGIGIETNVAVTGTGLTDLTISSPTGETHHAVFMGSTTSGGVTTNHFAACFEPPFSLSTGFGTDPLAGGAWQVTLSGAFKYATWTATARMAYTYYQQADCPASEQNLVP